MVWENITAWHCMDRHRRTYSHSVASRISLEPTTRERGLPSWTFGFRASGSCLTGENTAPLRMRPTCKHKLTPRPHPPSPPPPSPRPPQKNTQSKDHPKTCGHSPHAQAKAARCPRAPAQAFACVRAKGTKGLGPSNSNTCTSAFAGTLAACGIPALGGRRPPIRSLGRHSPGRTFASRMPRGAPLPFPIWMVFFSKGSGP